MSDDCDHADARGIGSAGYVDVQEDTYRVERWECDTCGQRFATVLKQVDQIDIDGPKLDREIVADHRNAWTETDS